MTNAKTKFKYLKNFKTHKYLKKYHHDLRLIWIKKLVEKGSVLDVGCLDTPLLLMLKNKEKTGIDINKEQIEKNKSLYSDINFEVADMNKLKFKENSFDNVICSEVLQYSENPEKTIRELHRVCKNNLIVAVPTYLSLFCPEKYSNPKEGKIHDYTPKKIIEQLENNGFKIKKIVGTRFITIPEIISKRIKPILLRIDLYLNDKPFFRTHGFHTIIKAKKIKHKVNKC